MSFKSEIHPDLKLDEESSRASETKAARYNTPIGRCRAVTCRRTPCKLRALRGHDFCLAHARYRNPVCPACGRPRP